MTDPGGGTNATGPPRRFLTYRMGERLYAIAADEVSKVIRVPPVARVPLGPRSLLGLANHRGSVLPIASLRGLLDQAEIGAGADSRAIILEGEAPVGLVVDVVEALVSVDSAKIEARQAELVTLPGELVTGAFEPDGLSDIAKILDVKTLIQAAFVQRERSPRTSGAVEAWAADAVDKAETHLKLITFEVAGQEFALPLEVVREIVPPPEIIVGVPRSEALVLGVVAYRDVLLPLHSLRALLGFPPAEGDAVREKVMIVAVGGVLVGLVADRTQDIVSADPVLVEPTPAMLAARTGGEARISAIYRAEGGARLIAILSPDQLFRADVMATLETPGDNAVVASAPSASAAENTRQFLIFQLDGDEFALPIEVVDEVARAPEHVTRLPKAPAFLEGVINLRGEVLPVIDQRHRFDMPPATDLGSRRLIVVRTERHRAGLMVDAVSEVLRTAVAIEPAPHLAGEVTRLVQGVINLTATDRMVLLLDPAELLTRAERGLLDAFQEKTAERRGV